jgi:TrmH family RNA methyltransferase
MSKPTPVTAGGTFRSDLAAERLMRETTITSLENAVFKQLRDTLASKGIKKHETFLVFGERAVHDVLSAQPSLVRDVIICQRTNDDVVSPVRAFLSSARKAVPAATVLTLSKALFKELDVFGTHSPMLALRTPEIPEADLSVAPHGLEILCALSDPSNVGALLRSAAAFGAARVILLKESASPFHPKAIRAASAATLVTKLARGPSINEIASQGKTIALDMKGTPLNDFAWPKDVRLLLGEEGLGVPGERSSISYVAIPMAKSVESLNATVAASIAMYAYRAQH